VAAAKGLFIIIQEHLQQSRMIETGPAAAHCPVSLPLHKQPLQGVLQHQWQQQCHFILPWRSMLPAILPWQGFSILKGRNSNYDFQFLE
jgi:hypothetical protein